MKNFLQASALLLFLLGSGYRLKASTFPVTATHTDVTCYGGANGIINVTPGGGTAPYTYLWGDGNNSQNRTNLTVGTYNVTVTDNNGATGSIQVILGQGNPFFITKSITGEPCGGDTVGTVTLNVTGSYPGYTFLWSNGDTSENLTGLTAAVYYVTVTDVKNCTTVDSADVTQPPGVGITAIITDATCGGANGTINITVQFGNPAYTFQWGDGSTSQNRTGLATGNYYLTVTDAIGCTATATEVVPLLPGSMTVNTSTIEPSCFNGSDGAIDITSVIGGISPYTYAWSNGAGTQNITGIAAGTYTVTVTSSNNCTVATSVTLGQPTSISVTLHPVTTTCFGGSNGAINIIVSGGTPTYSYHWNDGSLSGGRIGLTSGNYTVTVTDSKNCTATATVFVPQPSQIAVIATITSVSCIGGATGAISVTDTGGTGPYSYWWGAGHVSSTRTNLVAGNYTVTVTDAEGCTVSLTSTVPSYTPTSISSTQADVSCFGGSNGSITLMVSNGATPYTYSWSNGDTTKNISNLIEGNYSVTVTDNNGCTNTYNVSVTAPSFPITINSTIADENCSGNTNGSITINVTNAANPCTYNWGGGINSQNRTNLGVGSYNLTVTDNNGCTATDVFAITQPLPLSITQVDTNAKCFGTSTGAIGISVTGGFAPYLYHWNNGATADDISGIPSGNYDVTVTDNHGCTATASAVITQPTNATITPTVTNVSCFGGSNGAITISVSGATPAYTYNWGGGVFSSGLSNITVGTYTLTVTDNAGCTFTSTSTITQPAAITIAPAVTNTTCNGGTSGAITLNVNGGTSPYVYNWNDGANTGTRNNLAAGTYIVTVTDNALCTASASATVTQPTTLSVITSATNVTCNAAADGNISLTVTGGSPAYTYHWNTGGNGNGLANLGPGTYSVTITDNAGCTAGSTTTITQPTPIAVASTITNVLCGGTNTGAINLTVTGGSSPYGFHWSDGINTMNRANLAAGTYTVTITDNTSCTASASAIITQPAQITVNATAGNVSCNGGNNGSINVVVTGGVLPYTFNWNDGNQNQNRNTLTSGNYSITITDANNCTASQQVTVTQPNPIALTYTVTNATCFGQQTGGINLNVAGGSPGFNFLWSNFNTSQNLQNIGAGTYTVTATDANSCTASTTANVSQPQQITTSIFAIVDAKCFGATNGAIDISANGGGGGYTYLWSNGTTNPHLTGVPAGTYSVTITDANSCSIQSAITITQPAQISANLTNTNEPCFGDNKAAITCTATGGNGGYIYNWSNGSSAQNPNNLAAGTYTLTITDVNSCSGTFTAVISQPASINLTPNTTNVACNGGATGNINLNVLGGAMPYQFSWNGGATTQNLTNLIAGTYTVTVTDANSCSTSTSVNVTEPAALTTSTTQTNYACNLKPGSINLTVNGGSAPYNYSWNDGVTTQNRNNLMAGNYAVTITDANACTITSSVSIAAMLQLSTTVTKTDVTCYAGSNGSAIATASGGTPPYKYSWSNGINNQSIINVAAALFSVTVSDANQCDTVASITIVQPNQILVSPLISDVACNGESNGAISITVSGGTGSYSFNWSNSSSSQNITGLTAGSYGLTVTDGSNCTVVSTPMVVTQPAVIQAIPSATPVGCSGANGGDVTLAVNGGTPPYNFRWSNQATTQNLTEVSTGTYTVTVTDIKNCSAIAATNITTIPPLVVSGATSNASCNGVNNGSIEINVSGGSPAYSYLWSNGAGTANLDDLAPGNYSITVSDTKNCTAQTAFTLSTDYDLQIHASGGGTIKDGQSITLNVTANADHGNIYSWSPAGSLSCNSCTSPVASPNQYTLYTVWAIDANGCKAVDTVSVDVNTQVNIFIPNVFSPNGDGNNDEFKIFGDFSIIRYFECAIFDRWGEKVFESNNYQFAWDGTYKGEPAQVGNYVYMMTVAFADGSHKDYKGSVMLLK